MPAEWPIGIKVGVCILATAGMLSFISTIILTGFIVVSSCKSNSNSHSFSRSHLAAYFVCLLFCDAVEAISSILNFGSVSKGMVTEDALCTVQAALKHFGHVGTALWLLVIAIHTFFLLFYQAPPPRWVFFSIFSGVWILVLVIMLIGPMFLSLEHGVPFYGRAGMWCWIRSEYTVERYALQYGLQFLSAIISLILYTLLFFRLRGNIHVEGWCFHFQRRPYPTTGSATILSPTSSPKNPWRLSTSSQRTTSMVDPKVQIIARNMMLYPTAYMILLVPHTIVRFLTFSGHTTVPDGVILFTATVLMLNGLMDVILFILTRPSATAGRYFLPRSLRTFFGLSHDEDDRGSGRQVLSHHSSAQEMSSLPIEQTRGINIEVNIERKSENCPGSRVSSSNGWQRSGGLHGLIDSLEDRHRNSSSLTAYNGQERRIYFEDELGRNPYASSMKAEGEEEEKSQVKKEAGFVQFSPSQSPSPVAEAPARVYYIGLGDTRVRSEVGDGDFIIPHPYNAPTMR
ncbi:hypothetical protein FRC16_002836 [Serendipita sp. 398]|nr:hypothetical protein FRC16_002836 [Serendipita sp. 398]